MISELLPVLPLALFPIGDTTCYGENGLWTQTLVQPKLYFLYNYLGKRLKLSKPLFTHL